MKKVVLFVVLSLIVSSCFQSKKIRIIDNYFVAKLGDSKTNWLFFGSDEAAENGEGILAGVKSLGFNSEFIIVECSLEQFYIIQHKKNKKTYFDKKLLIGPLDESIFLKKKAVLQIENIEFTIYP